MPQQRKQKWEQLPNTSGEVVGQIGRLLKHNAERSMYVDDPVKYFEVFSDYYLWSKQKDIVKSVYQNKWTLVRSCNSSGKTHVVGGIHWSWLDIYHPKGKDRQTKVISTSKNYESLRLTLWSRIREMYRFVAERFNNAPMNLTDFHPEEVKYPEWFSAGYNPKVEGDEATAFQGHHGEHVLFIFEECINAPAALFRAIEGSMVDEGSHFLGIYNPTTTIGSEVYAMEQDAIDFDEVRDEPQWERPVLITIKASDLWESPEYIEDPSRYKNLVTPRGAAALEAKYGREHPVVKARIYAEWPEESENAAISFAALKLAFKRYGDVEYEKGYVETLLFGWDVAGEGSDSNVLYRGSVSDWLVNYDEDYEGIEDRPLISCEKVKEWNSPHPKSITYVYTQILKDYKAAIKHNKQIAEDMGTTWDGDIDVVIAIDAIGEGSHAPSTLEQLDEDKGILTTVIAFKAGETADKIPERDEIPILNRISEAWYRASLVFSELVDDYPVVVIQKNTKLKDELRLRKRFYGPKLKEPIVYYIEPKDAYKKDNQGKSPDDADAFLMMLYGFFNAQGDRIRVGSA